MKPVHYTDILIKVCFNCGNRGEKIGGKCFKHEFYPQELGTCTDWKDNKYVR